MGWESWTAGCDLSQRLHSIEEVRQSLWDGSAAGFLERSSGRSAREWTDAVYPGEDCWPKKRLLRNRRFDGLDANALTCNMNRNSVG